jgi:hypothetical protein
MPLVTRLLASSELAWGPMASSSVNFCRKTRTVPFSLFINNTAITLPRLSRALSGLYHDIHVGQSHVTPAFQSHACMVMLVAEAFSGGRNL